MSKADIRIAIAGISGRMGRMLAETVAATKGVVLAGATERNGHDWIGKDLSTLIEHAPGGVIVADDPVEVLGGVHALLDFTSPAATVANAAIAAQARVVHVVGTTGLTADDMARLEAAARHAVIVQAGNMSLGVNLLVGLTRRIAAALDEDFDIEVVEMHHHHKVDAPSGTALMLGRAAAEGRGIDLDDMSERGRDGITGARKRGAIGFAALRGGDVVGEHDVIFAAPGERIVLRHIATDRAIFARGAVKAAIWGQGQKPGLYSMADVLGL